MQVIRLTERGRLDDENGDENMIDYYGALDAPNEPVACSKPALFWHGRRRKE